MGETEARLVQPRAFSRIQNPNLSPGEWWHVVQLKGWEGLQRKNRKGLEVREEACSGQGEHFQVGREAGVRPRFTEETSQHLGFKPAQ